MDFAIKHLVFQGNVDAAGFTINNLNLAGLNLTNATVGLGNVDNTSDLLKPISTLTQNALNAKEDFITPNDVVTDYFGGDKQFHHLGALALQGSETTLQALSVIGPNATSASSVSARRNDYSTSLAASFVVYYGASFAGSLLGLSAANSGALSFLNATNAFLYTNNTAPLIFGHNNLRRMRLMTGLNVGGDTDPGAGCIEAADTITADHFEGDDLTLTGGATFNGDVTITGGGSDLIVGGSVDVAGQVDAALGFTTASNITGGGNLAVVGAIISFSGIPTADPHVAGRLWRTGTALNISTG